MTIRTANLAVLVLVASMAAVTACGEDDEGTKPMQAGAERRTPAGVPEGVAAQYATIEEEVKAEGGEQLAGPWRIAYIVEPAEGWFERRGRSHSWRAPAEGETHHIEILPIEAETGRLVPEVPVTLEVLDGEGKRVARKRLRSYYAEFFHYAENFAIPKAGRYTLKATIEPPPLRRHGEQHEDPPLAEGAQVEFRQVRLEPS